MKIKTNDNVVVIAGKFKGMKGLIVKSSPKTFKVWVAGINERIKHQKATNQNPGQKITKHMPLAVCKVALIDPKTSKPTRVGYRFVDGKKVRFSKNSNTDIL
ncbi:MAG: 50S ribosomal protein L24 [Alphaproteobacteria bacterium]|nr:50S ribosomal protein L24 [Alphaproteobacteria bacterium]MBL0718176.1 50S ribosomal protein L24 [Alphaproteobacteria bacterium]